jgi:hypothetical protein
LLNGVFGLEAISSDIAAVQTSVDALDAKLDILIGCNHDSEDLSGQDLVGADLRECSFRHADLRGADLTGANLGKKIDDSNAILHGVDLTETALGSFFVQSYTSITYDDGIGNGEEEPVDPYWRIQAHCGNENTVIDIIETDVDLDNAILTYKSFQQWINAQVSEEPTVFTILCEVP